MPDPFSPKQVEFIKGATKKWNFAHGSVRSGKTECGTFAFMCDAERCPDSKIYIVGKTFDTAKRNIVDLILNSPRLAVFRPFCTWSGKKLYYKDKTITVLGAKDEGSIGNFQGDTHSLTLCDEITLYPDSIIEMINSRLSMPYSKAFATMNPTFPDHIIKKWIDMGHAGDPNYFSMHFVLEDNIFVSEQYKKMVRDSSSGLFYKRNYLGLWCLAEGAIFDFFDPDVYVVRKPPTAAEYWVAGIDYGTNNAFTCMLMGVSTGQYTQEGVKRWFEKEYVWDSVKKGKQKTNSEYANDVEEFLQPYGVRAIYVDPSAASFKLELRRKGFHVVDANNDVLDGIAYMSSEIKRGAVTILRDCPNMIREMQSYVWDSAAAKKGDDEPLKKNDHCIDAARYVLYTHKVTPYQPYKHNPSEYNKTRFDPGARR
jgi:PBSX family phage terminase large subunit